MEDASMITFMCMLSVFSVLGTIGNSLVLYIYSHEKKNSTAKIFIMSLAGTDLLTCLVIMPFEMVIVYLQGELEYDLVCKLYSFLFHGNIQFATFIMSAIAIDRYCKICHPFRQVLNIVRAKIIVVCLLGLASISGIIFALSVGTYVDKHDFFINVVNISELYNRNETGSYIRMPVDFNSSTESAISLNMTNVYAANSSLIDHNQDNVSSHYTIAREEDKDYTGMCNKTYINLSPGFISVFEHVYTGTYLFSISVVILLYALIFRSIRKHRAQLSKWKRSSRHPSGIENVETQLTAVTHMGCNIKHSLDTGQGADGQDECLAEVQHMRPPAQSNRHAVAINQNTLIADIRLSMMLLIVIIVFILAFLPVFLMNYRVLRFNYVIYFMDFMYHTINPFIYTCMNKSFRDNLKKVIKCQSMTIVR